jgi:hypothetical protein
MDKCFGLPVIKTIVLADAIAMLGVLFGFTVKKWYSEEIAFLNTH